MLRIFSVILFFYCAVPTAMFSRTMLQQVSYTSNQMTLIDPNNCILSPDTFTVPSDINAGTLWTTLSITPSVSGSTLLIEGQISGYIQTAGCFQIAIFDGVSSEAVGTFYGTLSDYDTIPFSFPYAPGNLNPLTFTVKFGISGTSVISGFVGGINGDMNNNGQLQLVGGGSSYSSIHISEMSPD